MNNHAMTESRMDKQEINRLAYNISTNDWDEKEKIIVGNYEISKSIHTSEKDWNTNISRYIDVQ